MQPSKRSVVILDLGRSFGSQDERAFSDHLALEFHKAGWHVDWHLDTNDVLALRPYARLHRTLKPVAMTPGLVHFVEVEPPIGVAGAHKNVEPTVPVQIQHATQAAAPIAQPPAQSMAMRDRWARNAWHDPESGFATRAAALATWASIRVYYRFQYGAATLQWRVRSMARAIVSRVYWRGLYPHVVEPVWHAVKAIRWRIVHPLMEALGHSVKGVYWRFVYPYSVEPVGNLGRRAYWRFVHPVSSRLKRLRDQLEEKRRRWFARAGTLNNPSGAKTATSLLQTSAHVDARNEAFDGFALWLKGEIEAGRMPNLIVLPAAEAAHFEALLSVTPILGIERPMELLLVAHLAGADRISLTPSVIDTGTLAWRLGSGNPFNRLIVVDSLDTARRDHWCGLPLVQLTASGPGLEAADVPSRAAAFARLATDAALVEGEQTLPSLVTPDFGPLAIVSSALWGQVGSTTIFESQTRVLLEHGYRVARFYIDHWPHFGEDRLLRIARMVSEDQQQIRPHYQIVLERDESGKRVAQLLADQTFQDASPVARMGRLLAAPQTTNMPAAKVLGDEAEIAIINHIPHFEATREFTSANVVLETHDVFSHLLDIHGVPNFVPKGPDSQELRLSEERKLWASAELCVNLSSEDHTFISPHARQSAYVRPTKSRTSPSERSWLEVARANRLPPEKVSPGYFDIMLWGSWHETNVQSVKWFIEEVRPRLGRHAQARIVVAGKLVKGLGKLVAQHPDILFCDFIDHLEDFASRSRVLVIPDQMGTGICVKAIDALAWGACFAATRSGMRGMDLDGGRYKPAESAAELAADISILLDSFSAREHRRMLADQLFELNFSHATYERHWLDILERVAPEAHQRAMAVAARTAGQTILADNAPLTFLQRPSHKGRPVVGKPALSIVVATYDRYDVLPDAIESLRRQELPGSYLEIIVVDNSPDQEKAAAVAERYAGIPELNYIIEPTPGLSNARNVGTAAAKSDLVAFIDDDAIADKDWAIEIVKAFDQFENVGIVGGRIVPRWVTPKPSWLPNKLTSHLSIVDWGGELRELESDKWVAGCNISFRKAVLESVGGFSRALGRIGSGLLLLSNDETAVAEKIHAKGYSTVYAPAAKVDHVIDPTRLQRQWFRRRAAWQSVSDFIKDPKATELQLSSAIEHVQWAAKHRKSAVPLGFYGAVDDVEAFQQDVGVAYDFMKVLLAGGMVVPGDEGPDSARTEPAPKRRAKSKPKAAAIGAFARRDVPLLSVVVATYDRYDVLVDAIASLLAQDIAEGVLEIIVVDNSPNQEAAAQFAGRYEGEPRVNYLFERKPGLSNARNVGIANAKAGIVAFIDDDAIAEPGWAGEVLDAFETLGPDAGCVGGRILPKWVSPQPHWLPDSLLGYLSIVDWGGQRRVLGANEWLAGCNIAFRKEVLLAVGGFTESLGRIGSGIALLSNEDNDMIERVKGAGKSIVFAPAALVYHVIDPARLTRQWFLRRSAWQAASDFIRDAKVTSKYASVATTRLFGDLPKLGDLPGLGFFHETNDSDEFGWQVGMMYDMVVMSLAGGEEITPEGRLTMSTTLQGAVANKLKATARSLTSPGSRLRRAAHWVKRW